MSEEKCIIGEGIRINGRLSGTGPVDVEGQIQGNVALDGDLVVLEPGSVYAEVEAHSLEVQGRLEGEVVVNDLISLQAGCHVVGNLKARRIVIAEGAKFKGNIEMDVDMDLE